MKVLYMDWECFGREDLIEALNRLGHTVVLCSCKGKERVLYFEMDYVEQISKEIQKYNIEIAFSMNYYPSVSEACQNKGIPYVSWVYDSPYAQIYGINVINDCNYIFTFDRFTYNKLVKKGVKTVYYSPLAANTKRLDKMYLSHAERKNYGADVSFVGSFYNETDDYYKVLVEYLNEHKKKKQIGYFDAIIDAQSKVYGYNFIENLLFEHLIQDIREIYPYNQTFFTYFAEEAYIFSWVIVKRVTEKERKKLLTSLSERFEVKVFTQDEKITVGNCVINGKVHYYDEAPRVFKSSKINLNMTLRSIETGIPLRAIEIMGAGGFLLTNYQEDFLLHFEPDKDFVYFESEEDLLEKTQYYLKHDTEREKIAKNGHQRIAQDYTFEKRLENMIQIAVKNKGNRENG